MRGETHETDEASNEGMPEHEPGKRERSAPTNGSVRLACTDPWCTAFTLPQAGGVTLVIDRSGADVPAEAANGFIQLAAKSGVRLEKVSDS